MNCLTYRRKKENSYSRLNSMVSTFRVSYWDLHKATNGFSLTNLVGAGSCGSVYKGVFDLANVHFGLWYNGMHTRKKIIDGGGTAVAVKVFKPQRRGVFDSFIAQCEALRYIRHRNLVKVMTTCSGVDQKGQDFSAIVYEFMQNGSLESWLHSTQEAYQDGHNKPHILNIHTRINIAIDVACALDYLHNQYGNPIIHCNLKPSNILLGSDMAAHVTDVGLAKSLPKFPYSVRSSSLGLQKHIVYVAPECNLGSIVSTKGDVYSYGILLLEMLTGKKPTDPMFHGGLSLHDFVSNALPDRVMDIIDPIILLEFIKDDAAQRSDTNTTSADKENEILMKGLIIMFNIGVKCTMKSPQVRPHISDVLSVLETVRTIFKTKKGFVDPYLNKNSQAAALMAMKPMKFIMHRRKKENPNSSSYAFIPWVEKRRSQISWVEKPMKFILERKKEKPHSRSVLMLSSFKVSYEHLHKATNGFSLTNLVGTGGFGSVYKGIFDQGSVRFNLQHNRIGDKDGIVIAVKVFNLQRRGAVTSFTAECTALRNISYKNLVKIVATCTSVDEEGHDFRAIVYEFMERGSLESWLHSAKKEYHDGLNKPQILNLYTRINIAIDVACAINYLHHQCEQPIIHCDLKPSNILLDRDMIARVADFGLAMFLPKSSNSGQSSTIALRGTTGYIPPEYGLGSMVSTKGDVYSFGILLLEMLTGKKPTNRMFHGGINLHNFAWMAFPDHIMDITDPALKRMLSADEGHGNQMRVCLTGMFNIGLKCSMPSPQVRPDICDVLCELKSLQDMFKEIELQATSPIRD